MIKTLPVILAAWLSISFLAAQEIRPVRDSIGYCWNAEQMKRLVDFLAVNENKPTPNHVFVAGISPHDDFLYAGQVYLPLFRSIKPKEVVVFGVTHGTVRKEIGDPQGVLILDEHKTWQGCGREVTISPLREFIKCTLDTQYFLVSNKAHDLEHSIEAMIPWLQYFNPDVEITPIMVTMMPFERMEEVSEKLSEIFSEYIKKNQLVPGRDIFFLCSSDANHYGRDFNNVPFGEDRAAHTKGIEQDQQIANKYLSGTIESKRIQNFTGVMKNLVWCGKFSVPFGLLTTEKTMRKAFGKNITGTILRYSDSYSEGVLPLKQTGMGTTAPFSLKHWVGYLSMGYWIEE
jgi:AmmeMemoRadiSam system protein B